LSTEAKKEKKKEGTGTRGVIIFIVGFILFVVIGTWAVTEYQERSQQPYIDKCCTPAAWGFQGSVSMWKLVITDEEIKTTRRMPRELLKDLKSYALENDTNVTAVVVRASKEFFARDKMFKEKYRANIT
jgi:hypothetical protein